MDKDRDIKKMLDKIQFLKTEINETYVREKDYIEREEQADIRWRESKQRQKHNLNLIIDLKKELYGKETSVG